MDVQITTRREGDHAVATATMPDGQSFSYREELEPHARQFAQLAGLYGDEEDAVCMLCGVEIVGGFGDRFKSAFKKVGTAIKTVAVKTVDVAKKIAKSKLVAVFKKLGPYIRMGINAIPVYGQMINAGISGIKAVAKIARSVKASKEQRSAAKAALAAVSARKKAAANPSDSKLKLAAAKAMKKAADEGRKVKNVSAKKKADKKKKSAKAKATIAKARRGDRKAKLKVAAAKAEAIAQRKPSKKASRAAQKLRQASKKASAPKVRRVKGGAVVQVESGRRYRVQRAA